MSIVYLSEKNGYPAEPNDSIFTVPQYRFDEVYDVVNNNDILYEDITLDLYVIDSYLTYTQEIDTMIHSTNTHLFESSNESFVFRRINEKFENKFSSSNMDIKKDKILIEYLRGGITMIDKKEFNSYINRNRIYKLIPLDKNARGLYKNTMKDPYWEDY